MMKWTERFVAGGVGFGLGIGVALVAAVSTDGFGLGGDAVTARLRADPELIVFLDAGAPDETITRVGNELTAMAGYVEAPVYCDEECSLAEAALIFEDDPGSFALLNETNIPTFWRAEGVDGIERSQLEQLSLVFESFPGVFDVQLGPRDLRLTVEYD